MLPTWPEGTVSILSTAGEEPHAIPISTAIRAGERSIVFGLAHRRGSLERLNSDPRAAMTVLAAGDLAFTATGNARVLAGALDAAPKVAAVVLDVTEVQDHHEPTFEITGGVQWHWTESHAESRDRAVRAELRRLAAA